MTIQFNLFGIKTELDVSFFLLIGAVLIWGDSLLAFSSAFFSFLHELSHGAAAKMFGYTPQRITAGLFGGVLHLKERVVKPKHQLFIHLAGPAFNVLAALVLYSIYLSWPSQMVAELILSNLILALFNLMPFYPLDGGKIISLYLAFFFGYGRATRLSQFFSKIFTLFLFLLGIYLVQYNVMNLLICALAMNLTLVTKADNSFSFYHLTKHVEAGICQSPPKIVVYRADVPAISVLESYRPNENRLFTIVNSRGSYKGQLSEEEVLSGIYDCGIYADFYRLLDWKREKGA